MNVPWIHTSVIVRMAPVQTLKGVSTVPVKMVILEMELIARVCEYFILELVI